MGGGGQQMSADIYRCFDDIINEIPDGVFEEICNEETPDAQSYDELLRILDENG